MASNKAVIGILNNQAQAEYAVVELQRAGFPYSDISALFPDKTATRDFAHEKHTKAPEGAVAGASTGGLIGGTLGLLAGIGALAIPGVGPLIAAGPLLAALSGAAAGAAAGGITGALIGLGLPEIEAKQYEAKVRGGGILISVHSEDANQRSIAKKILKEAGASDITVIGEEGVPDRPKISAPHHSRP